MKRRFFLRDTVLGGLALPFLSTSCQSDGLNAAESQATVDSDRFPLMEATVDELRAMMENGERSARDITQPSLPARLRCQARPLRVSSRVRS